MKRLYYLLPLMVVWLPIHWAYKVAPTLIPYKSLKVINDVMYVYGVLDGWTPLYPPYNIVAGDTVILWYSAVVNAILCYVIGAMIIWAWQNRERIKEAWGRYKLTCWSS